MGNLISSPKNVNEDVTTRRQKDKVVHDSDEDDDNLILEIHEESSTESKPFSRDCKSLGCPTDQNLYTQVEDLITNEHFFQNGKMPEEIRHESVLDYLEIQEKMIVRIRVNARDKSVYPLFGTGCVYISSDTIQEYRECCILHCPRNTLEQSHKCYGGMVVFTNKHVIKDNKIAACSDVDFFYYREESTPGEDDNDEISIKEMPDKDTTGSLTSTDKYKMQTGGSVWRITKRVTAYGDHLMVTQENKDLIGLRILYHNPDLYNTMKLYSDLRLAAWSNIPNDVKASMKKYAIIISHPHGRPKQISCGPLLSLEEEIGKKIGRKITTYKAATCRGSSGAPVLTGHYSYRPFVHSRKHKNLQIGYSYSY